MKGRIRFVSPERWRAVAACHAGALAEAGSDGRGVGELSHDLVLSERQRVEGSVTEGVYVLWNRRGQRIDGGFIMNDKAVLDFFFELVHLRRIKHEGWRYAGIANPESVAEHSLRAAQIAYVLACMEKYPHPQEVCTMAVFHDIGETRVGDIQRVASRYVQADEERAVAEETGPLGEIGREILGLWKQTENRSSVAGHIAKDADLLEQAVSAREFLEMGYKAAQDWINVISKNLQTESARRLLGLLTEVQVDRWWRTFSGSANLQVRVAGE